MSIETPNRAERFEIETTLEALSERGQAIYETKLKPQLEPDCNNQFVAIHIDTEDYAVGRSAAAATRAIGLQHPPDGRLFIRKIGEEPEYSLAARILASAQRNTQSK